MNSIWKSMIAVLLMAFSLSLGAATTLPAGIPSADDEEEEIYAGDITCIWVRMAGNWIRVCQ